MIMTKDELSKAISRAVSEGAAMTNKRLGGPDSVVGRQMAEKTRQRRRELLARTQRSGG